jgi:hypothetical protein
MTPCAIAKAAPHKPAKCVSEQITQHEHHSAGCRARPPVQSTQLPR